MPKYKVSRKEKRKSHRALKEMKPTSETSLQRNSNSEFTLIQMKETERAQRAGFYGDWQHSFQ